MDKNTVDFIIECLDKYKENYLAEDHGWCGTGTVMHCQGINLAKEKLKGLISHEAVDKDKCKTEVRAGTLFCKSCGTPLDITDLPRDAERK